MTALEISRAEGLDPAASRDLLRRLCLADVIEPVPEAVERYRLSREPERIRLSQVSRALGASSLQIGLHPRVTLDDLLGWESRVFESPEIPQAA